LLLDMQEGEDMHSDVSIALVRAAGGVSGRRVHERSTPLPIRHLLVTTCGRFEGGLTLMIAFVQGSTRWRISAAVKAFLTSFCSVRVRGVLADAVESEFRMNGWV
jgi:hypothetical protein